MNCFDELTYAIFTDGELPPAEAAAVEAHLGGCARCRHLVNQLRAETGLLRQALAESDLEAPLPAFAGSAFRQVAGMAAAAMLAVVAGVRVILDAVGVLETPALDWLNPLNLNTRLSIFFQTVSYLFDEGASMVILAVVLLSVLLTGLLAAGVVVLVRRRPTAAALTLPAILAMVLALPASAAEIRRAGSTASVTVAKDQTVNDTLIAAGDSVVVDGTVTGNLIAAGRRITVRGEVRGDVIAAGQTVDIEGKVGGNVFSAGQFAVLRGAVGGSVHAWSQSTRLESSAAVEGDVILFGADLQLEGKINRDLVAFFESVDVRGAVGRNVRIHANRLRVSDGSSIGGDLTVEVGRENYLMVDAGAKIGGKVTKTIGRDSRFARFSRPKFYFWEGMKLLAALLAGAILLGLFPGFFRRSLEELRSWPRALGVGFAAFVGVPAAAVLVCITIIGIPAAVVLTFLWILGMYLAKIVVATEVGRRIMRRSLEVNTDVLAAMTLGLILYFVAANVPFGVGGVIQFAVMVFGLGALGSRLFQELRA